MDCTDPLSQPCTPWWVPDPACALYSPLQARVSSSSTHLGSSQGLCPTTEASSDHAGRACNTGRPVFPKQPLLRDGGLMDKHGLHLVGVMRLPFPSAGLPVPTVLAGLGAVICWPPCLLFPFLTHHCWFPRAPPRYAYCTGSLISGPGSGGTHIQQESGGSWSLRFPPMLCAKAFGCL